MWVRPPPRAQLKLKNSHGKILSMIISSMLIIIAIELFYLIKIQRADLRRELQLNSSVDCFSIKDVEEIIDIKSARENCRNSFYSIEREFGW